MTAETPMISVVVPVYNGARYLASAVESIFGQTFRDFELIVVDDGSTDSSPAILKEFAARDPRVRIISRPNTGIVGALNDGVAAARGKYIARMDADDIALPNRFEKQLAHMESHPNCVVCGGKILITDPDGLPMAYECRMTSDADIRRAMEAGGFYLAHPATMIRRETLAQAGGYRKEFEWVEDLDLWLRLGEKGELANVPDLVLRYRLHLGSLTHGKAEIQRARRRTAIAQSYQRRGITWTPKDEPPIVVSNPAGTRSVWALTAQRNGFWWSAVRIALKAVRAFPTRLQPWVSLGICLLGPIGRALIPRLVRWRERQKIARVTAAAAPANNSSASSE